MRIPECYEPWRQAEQLAAEADRRESAQNEW